MNDKKRLIKLIILVSVMTVLAITFVFSASINKFLYNFAFDKFNIVANENNLLVHYINVGQGDAIAINFPTGTTMLIDAGTKEKSVTYTTYIKEKVLANSRSNKIDYLVLTHADDDHIGGALRLLNNFEVGAVYLPYLDSDTDAYVELKNYVLQNCNYAFITNELSFENTGCEVVTFGPLALETENDTCPIIKIGYKDKTFLFTGDVSTKAEDMLINEYDKTLDCDVLKVAHHGSTESTSKEFLDIITPAYAVVSVGENSYGHPSEEVLNRLKTTQTNVLRTDKNGNILFAVGKNYELNYICENYYLTNLTLDIRVWVLVVEIILLVVVGIIVFKKPKQS